MKDVIIIGAGIAGLGAGHELYKKNIDFQILEMSNRIAGSIETLNINGCLIESGPHTFSSSSKEVLDLILDLGLEERLIQADPSSKNRYIYKNGELLRVPTGFLEFFKTNILSRDAKFTLFEELFIKKEIQEESVEDFISRRFGREILKNLIQPFLSGVYAGDVKKLSANAIFPKFKELENKYNSIILGFILSRDFKKSFKRLTLHSFDEGMEVLPNTLYKELQSKISLNVQNIEITRAKDFFIVNFKANNKTINYTTNSILFAIPSYKMNDFSYLFPDNFVKDFFNIEYYPIAVVNQLIDKSKINFELNGFGFLCTREPHRKLLGTLYSSSIFPTRAPKGKALLTSYIGGAYHRKVAEQTNEEISNLATKEVCESMHIVNPGSLETIHLKVHPNAIPQYEIGHLEKIKQIEKLMDTNYGIFFTGSYLKGISINDTIKTSKAVVNKIYKFLNAEIKKEKILVS